MSRIVEVLCSRRVPQVAALALVSIGFAGCSADMSSRLAQIDSGPQQSNHFGWQRESTGSVAAAPAAPVQRRELPQYSQPQYSRPQYQSSYQSQPLPPPISTPKTYPVASSVSDSGRSVHSAAPPTRPIESKGPVASRDGWNHNGGTPIIVGTSDTLEGLSHRYGVSTAEILKANGYRGPRRLQPGQQLIIPKRAAAAETHAAPAAKPVAVAEAASAVHYVNRGDTLMSIARRNHIAAGELARANGLQPGATLKVGMKITVPTKAAAVAAQPVAAAAAAPPAAAAPVVHTAAAAPEGPVQKVNLAVATTTPEEAVVKPAAKTAEATGALPTFRWPVRGRVIAAYGARTNGKSNDGINVAVPEGTPVKAAEDGVVAYSGNELKGYGNLILVRHPNGYVTAYAHASELLVKRGDTIKRGQVIAKSGQSGEAASPQLHFEIRKGSSPVDPLHFLNGA